MREGRARRKNGSLVLILAILILVIIGLSLGILWLSGVFSGEEPEPVVSEPTITTTPDLGNASEMSNTLMYFYGTDINDEEYAELISYLKTNAEDESQPVWARATAYYSLAYIKTQDADYDDALQLIEIGLSLPDVPDNYKYPLLNLTQFIYQTTGDTDKLIETIERMLTLPDDMNLYWLDWPTAKESLRIELDELKILKGTTNEK